MGMNRVLATTYRCKVGEICDGTGANFLQFLQAENPEYITNKLKKLGLLVLSFNDSLKRDVNGDERTSNGGTVPEGKLNNILYHQKHRCCYLY